MEGLLEFMAPFIVPFGILVLSATIKSVMKYGAVLSAERLETPAKGIRVVLQHWAKMMHYFYLACFAFDLGALVGLIDQLGRGGLNVSYSEKAVALTLTAVVVAIMVHMLAYFHTVFILREHEQQRAPRPITYLHFTYGLLSLSLMVWIRW